MVRYIVRSLLLLVLVAGMPLCLSAQSLTLAQALDAAQQYHPASRSASLSVQQQRQLLPAATALADPLVTAESPTGNFYTIGVTQSFELPGAYRRRKTLQNSHVVQAEQGVLATQQDVRYATALAYNALQYRIARLERLNRQDSLLQSIARAAVRQFEAGQVDAVASRFATLQATVLHTQLRQAEQDVAISEQQLQLLTGIADPIVPEPWVKLETGLLPDSLQWEKNPALQALRQETVIADQQVAVEKSAAWPQIMLGYINQGERNSPVANRFNAGLSIPLWQKQYRSRIDAAQTGVEIARQNLAAQSLRTGAEWSRTIAEVEQTSEALEDYAQQVLPSAQALTDASRRMFEGGLSDLPTYLRHGIEVLNLELGYWDLFARYREAQLKLRFIAGNL